MVEQPGRIRVLRKGKKRTFLDIRGEVLPGGEQGLLSVAFAARLPAERPALRLLRHQRRRPGDRGVPAGLRQQRRPLERPAGADDQPPRRVEPQRRPAPVRPRRLPLHRHRRRRGRRRPRRLRPGHRRACSARSSGSTRARAAATPTARPAPTRSSATRDATRSTRSGCATRSASRFDRVSPKGPHIVIGDVGQDRFEEIDYETVAGARGANFGWNDFEGNSRLQRRQPARPVAPRPPDQGLQPRRRRLRADRRLRRRAPRS